MTKNYLTKLSIALMLVLLGVGQLMAQAGVGSITGVVFDVNGAVIPNASVKLVSLDRGSELTTTASGDGIYNFTSLQPGKYSVSASGGNFAEQKLEVEVQVGRVTDANFTLGASGVAEQVTVTAEGVQTTQSNSDAVLSETAISNLPINGRRFQDFATLTPTAQIDTERNQISLSGQRGVNSNINVDGVDYNQPFFGGIRGGERSNFSPTIPQESIKEFNVVAAGYNAEFGRSTGGVINVVTKGGTNDFRGTAFYLIRPDKLSNNHKWVEALETARRLIDPTFKITAAPSQHQFGGSVGGPIAENRLFFFGSYEQQKFKADRFVVFGLTNITRAANNQEAYDYYASQQSSYELTNDGQTALGRVDWTINNSNQANFRYSWNKSKGLNSVAVGDAGVLFNPIVDAAISNEGTEIDRNNVFVTQWTSTFSSNYVNDFRFQYARGDRPRLANAETPTVTVSNIGLFGTRSFLPTTQYDTRIQFVEGFSILKGNHSIKIGGEFSDIFADQTFGFNQFGSYTFRNSGNAGLQELSLTPGVVDRRFDSVNTQTVTLPNGTTRTIPIPNTFYTQQIGNLQAAFHVKELAFYGQDSWRVTPSFTLNFGLRVEKQFNPEAQLGNDAIINAIRNASFPLLGNRGFDPTIIPDSKWQVGPRLGFAWDFNGDGKSVLRGFSGLYYARTPLIILAAPVNNFRIPPGDVTIGGPFTIPAESPLFTQAGLATFIAANPNYLTFLQAAGQTNCAGPAPSINDCAPVTVFRQFGLIGINAGYSNASGQTGATLGALPSLTPSQLQTIAGILGIGVTPAAGANLIAMDPEYNNPQSFQWGLGYEREVLPNVVMGVDYSYVNTIYLQRNRDINLPIPTQNANGRFIFNRNNRPTNLVGRLLLRESSGRSVFHGFTFRTRIIRSWTNLNMYYTISRSKSDDDNERNATGVFYENTFNLRSEYGLARLDRTHQFVANPVFFLPWGVELSSAIRLRSGTPFDAVVGSDLNQDSINNDRPQYVPGVPFERNGFRNRNEFTVDVRGQKGFSFGENRRLIFSAEVFNVFNNSNIQIGGRQTQYCLATNDQTCGFNGATNPTFRQVRDPATGQIITAQPGNFSRTPVFQMQLGVRLQF